MKLPKTVILILVYLTIAFSQHVPTDERGDPNYRRMTDIDGNKVRTSIFNFGLTGRTGAVPGEVPYEWPINTGKHYIALTGLFTGAEVITEEGDTLPFVTTPLGRTDNDGNSMMFEPVPEYLNSNSSLIAKSDEPDSWPTIWPDKMGDEADPGWPGAWNGFFGKNQFNADQEIYFKISDDNNFLRGATYYPDTTDYSRQGMGLLAGVRVMEWSQVLVEDVVFILYEIKNDGTKDLDKVSFSLWLADLVGGDGDSQDDQPDFDLLYDIAWSKDRDGIGNEAFGGDPVGVAATAYLETPGNAADRIDNDGDGEDNGPKISEDMLSSEDPGNRIDDNRNGLVDESMTHVPFNSQEGVTYANRIDDDGDGESGSPTITQDMVNAAAGDITWISGISWPIFWKRWPPNPDNDSLQNGQIHLIMVEEGDVGRAFADNIDNNLSEEYPMGLGADIGSPTIDSAIVLTAETDEWHRYRVPGTDIILYDVDWDDLGLPYADGVDNDGDGAVDEGIDEGIDEMVDESRDDYVDNDFDWNPFMDDVGLDGDGATIDEGQNDSRPTSGAGGNLPGEPSIDKTDVAESDQMGLTAVQYDEAGGIPTNQDNALWLFYMIPGEFWQPPPGGVTGDFDLFVTSSFFPLEAGQTERISMAVCLGEDEEDAIRNKDVAQKTYDEDYQFAKQPNTPTLQAIPGDGKVTLVWDDAAELSFDSYMFGIGSEGYDFEGYRIYRATDPAFEDAYTITDAQGNKIFYDPIAIYDKVDGIYGYHDVPINGVHYRLSENLDQESGLVHTYVDEDVINGQTYYYAVVAFDFGGDLLNEIPPTESNKRITINTLTGEIRKGTNVAVVTPNPSAAGYVEADIDTVELVQGSTSSTITYEIVDPLAVLENHRYQITFEDTLLPASGSGEEDTLTTWSYTLLDITNQDFPDTLAYKSEKIREDDEQPIIDGFRLTFHNEDFVMLDDKESGWTADSLWRFSLNAYSGFDENGLPFLGRRIPADYRVEISEPGTGQSTHFVKYRPFPLPSTEYPVTATNFIVKKRIDITGDDATDWQEIPFAFGDFYGEEGILDAESGDNQDEVIFLDNASAANGLGPTWVFKIKYPSAADEEQGYVYQPTTGDTALLIIFKPFLSTDVFEFTTLASEVDKDKARNELADIQVVPNPYRATIAWEQKNPYTSGRGPRSIHFNKLPQKCTIRIFTVTGELVKVIEHDDIMTNGTEEWNLLTKDNLAASYGIYIYHVDAPGIGEHVGKFAVIK